ncbi:MAG: major tail protein [Peptoanaerobacter stomatis]|uniref:major tail protein n=1 Tax=Peptoanaerobacter stomatis TaxID=796937 RepID=UPI003F9EDC05
MANKNKVEFGLKNVHIATEKTPGTWNVPKAIPGAVSFTPDVESDGLEFYADDSVYYSEETESLVKGEMEMALFPDWFLGDVLGYKKTSDGGTAQILGAKKKKFILIFEGDGDKNKNRYMYLNCGAGALKEDFKTNEKGKTIKVQKISITVEGINVGTDNDRVVKLKYASDDTAYATLFTKAPAFGDVTLSPIVEA